MEETEVHQQRYRSVVRTRNSLMYFINDLPSPLLELGETCTLALFGTDEEERWLCANEESVTLSKQVCCFFKKKTLFFFKKMSVLKFFLMSVL